MTQLLECMFWLIAGHAVADFALQTRWMTVAKNQHSSLNLEAEVVWPIALSAHGLIHGAAVALVTGSTLLGVLEAGSHVVIDYAKSDGRFGLYADQILHVLCKVIWLILLSTGAVIQNQRFLLTHHVEEYSHGRLIKPRSLHRPIHVIGD